MPAEVYADAPVKNFVRRAYHACRRWTHQERWIHLLIMSWTAISIGDYVFVGGGEIAMTINGSMVNILCKNNFRIPIALVFN